ncbi:unnamed protein product [Triticum turgidum subsp. durum]|uniref:Uncharacterized protein n=1 Tax=Triticum turgidum subsp. durum TaxID=4567 RepID=A0A9R1QW18_TRITD|nr:unnamed protein product [Triticum turgidum subsp. durum]
MSQEENNVVALSAFTNGSNPKEENPMEANLSFSKKISDGSSCEDDADSSMRSVHTKILKDSHVEQIEHPLLVVEENHLLEHVGENVVGEHIHFEAELDEGDVASDVEVERLHRVHEEPITYFQLRRVGADGRSMKRRRIDE